MKNYAHQNSIEWITHTHKICWPECDKESRWCCHHHHHLLVGLLVSRMWCLAQTLSITFIAVLFAPVPFSPPPPIFLSFHPLPVCVYTAWMQFPTTICVCVAYRWSPDTTAPAHRPRLPPFFFFVFKIYFLYRGSANPTSESDMSDDILMDSLTFLLLCSTACKNESKKLEYNNVSNDIGTFQIARGGHSPNRTTFIFLLILIFGVVPIGPISRNKRLYDNDQ